MMAALCDHVSPPSVARSTATLAQPPPFESVLPNVSRPSSSVPSDSTRIIPPIEPENDEVTKICCGSDQVAPASVDLLKNVCCLYDRELMMPWSEAWMVPPGRDEPVPGRVEDVRVVRGGGSRLVG